MASNQTPNENTLLANAAMASAAMASAAMASTGLSSAEALAASAGLQANLGAPPGMTQMATAATLATPPGMAAAMPVTADASAAMAMFNPMAMAFSAAAAASSYPPSIDMQSMFDSSAIYDAHAIQQHAAQHHQRIPSSSTIPQTVQVIRPPTQSSSSSSRGKGGEDGLGMPEIAALPEKKVHLRKAADQMWNDTTLDDWPESDFRVFCGDLGNEVTDELLANAFRKYTSFQKARVVRDKRTGKSRGYGFVSFADPEDLLRALKEMNRKYVGNRPIRVVKSRWREREVDSDKNRKMTDMFQTAPSNSKTLKKFKVMKPITGGTKKVKDATALARSRGFRGYHGPRPPPFGSLASFRE